jgi:hypothetical protein
MAKGIFKSGLLNVAPKNNTIKGANVKHLEQSNVNLSNSHTIPGPAIAIASFIEAAINLVNGNVSIANIENSDDIYFECMMDNGNICSMILNPIDYSLKYEYIEDFEQSKKDVWPLALVLLYTAANEKMSSELKDILNSIRIQVQKNQNISNNDAFRLCDYMVSRLNSKLKQDIDLDIECIEKIRAINRLSNGDMLKLEKDETMKFSGKEGVFNTIAFASEKLETNNNNIFNFVPGQFAFEDELTEEEKMLIPRITGAVYRTEYVMTMLLIFTTRLWSRPMNNVFAKGPSGCGKSFFTQLLASELGLPYLSIGGHDELGEATFKGVWKIGKDGQMYYELSKFAKMISRPCVIEIAESSAALATKLTMLYDLLDRDKGFLVNDDGVIIRRHPHAYIIFTCNTYASMNDIAPSIVARAITTLSLPMLDRNDIRSILLRELDFAPIDNDIMENSLDCVFAIEDFLKSPNAPRGCESSMRSYAYWIYQMQLSRSVNMFNPIETAKNTILPTISCAVNFDEALENSIIENIIAPTFNFFENGGV